MTLLSGAIRASSIGNAVLPQLSNNLGEYDADYWPTGQAIASASRVAPVTYTRPVSANPRTIAGRVASSYFNDYYNRVHITPSEIALGNLVSAQTRPISVWNAWLSRAATVSAIEADPNSGIAVTGQNDPPIVMPPLQELTWDLSIGIAGAATIDTFVHWLFASDPPLSVHITGQRVTAWMYGPNWSGVLTERLEWMTLVERGTNGNETSTPLREYPRRSWQFKPLAEGTDRQLMEALLFDASSRTWALPVWVEPSELAVGIALGVQSIPVETAGLDFHDGGLAILTTSPGTFETVEISTVGADALLLARPTLNAWPAGARIFPARTAMLNSYPTLNRYTTRLVDSDITFTATDANDYPATMPGTLYRGLPVLEDRPEWSTNPTVQYARDVELIDNDTGVVLIDDVSGLPWPIQSHRWQRYGRADHDVHRQLLYAFGGKVGRVWLPTWQDDLYPANDASGTNLDVARCGYTAYLHGQNGRKDIRVQLVDGTVLYRRIVASADLDALTERLQVDTAWPETIGKADIASISYMAVARLDTDAVEINYWTDSAGASACAVTFAQVPADV